jgi:drug/metabolite transporter (DMT)-like permease
MNHQDFRWIDGFGAGGAQPGVMKPTVLPLLATTVAVYAAGYPLGALALRGMSPFWLIALRFLLTAALLWPVVGLRRLARPAGRAWIPAIGAGLLVQGAQFLGAYWAMAHGVGAGVTALIVALNPALTALLGVAVSRVRVGRAGWAAVALAAAAVAIACLPRIAANPAVGPGVAGAVLALAGLAGGSVIQGRCLGGVHPLTFTAIGVSASAPPALALALLTPGHVSARPQAWLLLSLLTLCGLAGTTLYAGTVRTLGARTASLQFALIPAVASVMSWPLLGEAPGWLTAVGLVLGAAAVVLQLRAGRVAAGRTAPRTPPSEGQPALVLEPREEAPGAGRVGAQAVVGVVDGALTHREAAAADAQGEAVPDGVQLGDARLQHRSPRLGEPHPVALAQRCIERERLQVRRDPGQRHPDALGGMDHGEAAQDKAVEAPLTAARAFAPDQPEPLVVADRRHGEPGSPGHLPDRQQVFRILHAHSVEQALTSSPLQVGGWCQSRDVPGAERT